MADTAAQILAEALVAEAMIHEAERYEEIGERYDDVHADLLPFEDPAQKPVAVALRFWDGWIDARNHEWLYYDGIEREDWPRHARAIAACLTSNETPDDPILVRHFHYGQVSIRGRLVLRSGQLLTLVAGIALLQDVVTPSWPPWDMPWWWHFAALVFGLRMLQVRVTVDAGHLRVVNILRSRSLPWSEVQAIETLHERTGSRLMVRMRDGRVIKSDSIASTGAFGRSAVVARANELADRLAAARGRRPSTPEDR